MSNLIRDYNDKQQSQYASNLQMPKVTAPALQDAAPVADEQMQVTTPQAPPLEQMVAPDMGAMQQFVPQYDATAEFNNRLSRQLPTLLHGQPSDSERRASAFYDFIGTQIEENRKRSAAEAIVAPSLQQFNTPTKTRPNGFGSNVLKVLFGGDKQNASDDGVLGNEFDITKGRFGQYGNGVIGGAMYLLDNTLGLGVVRNTILDTGAGLASQAAGWAAKGGIIDTLFKTKDIGKAIQAGDNRYRQAMRNIYGDSNTSFLMQGLRGRDLGALGNLSGDTNDDYKKLYGSSPVAAGLDKVFFGRELTEQESKDYEKLTGYAVKEFARLPFKPEETAEYQEILGRVPEDFKTKMLLRNITGLVADIRTDDFLKPLIGFKPPTPKVDVASPELPKLNGTPERLQLEGASPNQRMLPPKERNTAAADQYIGDWLRRGESVETKPVGIAGELRGGGNDPWVTIDATAVRIPEALPGRNAASLPAARSPLPKARTLTTPGILPTSGTTRSPLPSQQIIDDIVTAGRESVNNPLSVTEAITRELRTSSAKSLVVSPPIAQVVTPQQVDVASVLRQQYMRRIEPGQYIVQRLGTIADTDPVIALKSIEPSPQVANPVRLALPPAVVAPPITLKRFFSNTDEALAIRNNYAAKTALDNFLGGHLKDRAVTRFMIDEALKGYFSVDFGLDELRRGIEDGSVATRDVIDMFDNILKGIDEGLQELGYGRGRGWDKNKDGKNNIINFKRFEGKPEDLDARLDELMLLDEKALDDVLRERAKELGVDVGYSGGILGDREVMSLGDLFKMDDSVDTSKYDATPSEFLKSRGIDLEGTAPPQKGMTLDEFAKGFFKGVRKSSNTEKMFAQSEGAKTTQLWYEDALVQQQIRSELLLPQSEIKSSARSVLPKTEPKADETLLTTKIGDGTQSTTNTKLKEPETASEVPPKLIPSSKEEILRKAKERLESEKAARSGSTATKKEEATTKVDVVKNEVKTETPKSETPKQRMLREAREKLDAEKAARRLESAVTEGFAKPVEGSAEVRVDVETPKGQELLNDAIDFDTLFNKTYAIEDLDTMISMVSRAAAGAPISFVGKVAPIGEVARSQKEVYRFASLVPHPTKPGKPLLAPTKSMVAEYASKYGVEHPYASQAIADSSMKYLTKNGGARRHKSLADLAAEQSNPLYRKILSPTGTPIPLAVIEQFEKQISKGGQALVKTSSDTVSAIDTTPKVEAQSQPVVKRSRYHAQKFIDDNNLGIKKNLSADKLNEYINLYETKGIDALPEEAFTKGVLSARKKAAPVTEAAPTKEVVKREAAAEPKREEKVTKAAKKVVKTETLEDFEDAVIRLEDLEPSLAELEAIEKKVSNLPIFDHRKKIAAPSHTDEVLQEVRKAPEVTTQQEELSELITQLDEVITQEQELYKTKQAIEVAIDNVDALNQAEISYFMKKYGLSRGDATEFQDVFNAMKARNGEATDISDVAIWQKSRKALYKGTEQVELNVDDLKIAPNYEQLRNESIAVGEYEKAAAWFYQNYSTNKATTNPVVRIDVDGNFEFISGRGTFLAAMDSGAESIPVQLLDDARVSDTPTASKLENDMRIGGSENLIEVVKELDEIPQEVKVQPIVAIEYNILNPEQSEAVRRYTEIAKSDQGRENYYRGINKYLRTGEVLPGFTKADLNDTITALDGAVEALPKHKGEVVRIVSPDSLPSDLRVGGVLQDRGYLSTMPSDKYDSGLESWSPIGGDGGRVEIRIKDADGALLEGFSEHGMSEVLLKRNTPIEITYIKELNGAPRYIEGVVKQQPLDAAVSILRPLPKELPVLPEEFKLFEAQEEIWKQQDTFDFESPEYEALDRKLDEINAAIDNLSDRSSRIARYKKYKETGVVSELLPSAFTSTTVAYKQEATAIESSIGKLSRDKQLSSEDIINASEEMLRYSETYGYLPPDSKAVKALEELRQNPRNHSKFMSFYGALKSDHSAATGHKNATPSALRGWEAPLTSRLGFTNDGDTSFRNSLKLEQAGTVEDINKIISEVTGVNFALVGSVPEGFDILKAEAEYMLRDNIIQNYKQSFGIDSMIIMHGSGRTALSWNAFKGALEQDLGKKTYILSCQSSCPRTATAIPDGYIVDTTLPDSVRIYSAISPDYGVSIPKDVIEEFKSFEPKLSPKVEETFTSTQDVLDFFNDLPAATSLEDIKNIADDFGYRFTIDLTTEANFDNVAEFQKWYERSLGDIKTKKLLSAKEVKPFENFMKTLDFEALNREIGDNLPELIRKVRENTNNTMRSEATLAGILVNGTRLKLGETINSTSQLKEVAVQNPELFKYVLRKAQRFVPSNKDLDLVLSLEETLGARPLKKGEVTLTREPLSRQNITDASEMAKRDLGYGDALNPNTPLAKLSRSGTPLKLLGTRSESLPKTVGEAVTRFKQVLMKVDETGVLDDQTQIDLNNSVHAMESLVDQSYAEKMRAVVRRLTGREAGEGKPFMSAAVELLNDDSRQFSRDEVADILSYAIGTKDVKFAGNMDDSEVLRFGRMIAKAPETFSQFDHVYVGHGTGIVEHGNWSLEARPRTGYAKRELVQHVIDNNYPRGTEVGVAACETGCPKRIQDSVPPLHRVVSRGAVKGSLENLQRLIEGLSAMPTNPKVMDVLAEYDGLMREALNANKQRGTEILERMRQLEDDFNDITKRNKFANEQRTRAKIKQAQDAMEKEFLGDC